MKTKIKTKKQEPLSQKEFLNKVKKASEDASKVLRKKAYPFLNRFIKLDELAEEYLKEHDGLALLAMFNECAEEGLPSQFDKEDLLQLRLAMDDLEHWAKFVKEDVEGCLEKEKARGCFQMTEEEMHLADGFCAEHQKCHGQGRTAGEAFQFTFVPSMLGNLVRVTCMGCGQSKDITDYDKCS